MKWIKDEVTGFFLCPRCGYMVTHNGYAGCDYEFCLYCGRPIEPVAPSYTEASNENKSK